MVNIDNLPTGAAITIYDLYGRSILTSREASFDVSTISAGIYIVRVDGSAAATKLIINR